MRFPGPDAPRAELDAFMAAKSGKREVVIAPRIPLPPAAPKGLHTPSDVDAAGEAWGANCGPTATAALLGLEVAHVRHAFPWFPERPWTSPSQLREALAALGAKVANRWEYDMPNVHAAYPAFGLVTLQIDGPWCALANKRAAFRYTHIAASQRVDGETWIYDVNAGPESRPGAWMPWRMWADHIMPMLVRDRKRATGWFVKVAIEVSR